MENAIDKVNYNDEIDLGEMECLSDDDIFQTIWIVGRMESDNIMDYFWEAELLVLCRNKNGVLFVEYSFNLPYGDRDIYKYKYCCYKDDFYYRLCDNETCDLCEFFSGTRIISHDYLLYQKFIQAIE